MIQKKLHDIKEFILKYNKYFDGGYSDVATDDRHGYVISHTQTPIFPADELGDYFYLRQATTFKFDYSNNARISDAYTSPATLATVFLIGFIHNDAPDQLLINLLNTLQQYNCNDGIKLISASYDYAAIIAQELKEMSKENIEAALQRFDNTDYTLVSINFTLTSNFGITKLNCIEKPCKNC